MDVKASTMVAILLGALCMVASAMSIPIAGDESNGELELGPADNKLDRRATWLDTRELEDDFKELVLLALEQLESEKRIKDVIEEQKSFKQKRGRWQGFCFRRTRNGRFLPYICWKGDRK